MRTNLKIFYGDITTLRVGAIVNAANTSLLGGGGVDGAIHKAAGPALLEECKKLNGCKIGEAKLTDGHRLKALNIIHAVGPVYGKNNGLDSILLESCYFDCLRISVVFDIPSIAFPCISTGVYGYPKEEAAKIAVRTVKEFINNVTRPPDEVIFCVFTDEDEAIYKKLLNE